jgi:hypothetical protein
MPLRWQSARTCLFASRSPVIDVAGFTDGSSAAPPAASDSPVGPGLVHVQELCKPWFELVMRFIFELLLCSRLC